MRSSTRGVGGHQLVGHRRRQLAARHQRRGVLLPHGRVLGHLLIQQRLRERRLVALVVAVAAVADQVDEEVEREALPVGPRQPRRLDAGLGVVGVDVHDWHLEAARQAAGVAGRERLVGLGGEAELVVGDDVDGAADVPAGEAREVERLGDDSLTGERGIAVDEDAEHVPGAQRRRAGRVHAGRRRPRHADQQRIDGLEMARVRRHRDDQRRRHVGAFDAGTGVVLDVAHPAELDPPAPREQRVLELGEDLRVRLLHHVRQHVEPAAMRHRDEHVLHPRRRRIGDDLVEDRHHQIEAFDRKAGLAGESAVQEPFERLDPRDPVEQFAAVDRIGRRPVAPRLDRLTQPHPLVGHEDVGEVVARGRAVDGAQPFDGLVGAGRAADHRPADDAGRQAAQHVGGQAVRLRMQRRVADRSVEADRIEPGRQVPVAADRLGQGDGGERRRDIGGAGGGRRRTGRVLGRRGPLAKGGSRRVVNRSGIPLEAFEQLEHVPRVGPGELVPRVHISIIVVHGRLPSRGPPA